MGRLKSFPEGFFRQVETMTLNLCGQVASEKGYSSLFKAGVVLVSASMIAISHAGAIVYDSDIEAHRAKFETEVILKGDLKNATQCFSLPAEHIARCRSAIYELDQVGSAWELTLKIFENCFRIGIAALSAAAIGFVAWISKPRANDYSS